MSVAYTSSILSCRNLYVSFKNRVFQAFPVLVVLGNLELWLGSSSLTVPWTLVVIMPIALVEMMTARKGYCAAGLMPFLLLYLLLFALGVLAALFDSAVNFKRNLVSLLPLCIAWLVLFSFKDVDLPSDVPKMMRSAGGLLGLMVLLKSAWLFLPVWWSGGFEGVIEQKGNMGLALGKSNFLAVFLMFFSVFAWRANKVLWLFMVLAACLTLSRFGVAFALLAAVCVSLLIYVRLSVVLVLLALAGAIMTLPVWLFSSQVVEMSHGFLPASLVARFELWDAALELLSHQPFLGAGPGGFTNYLELIAWPRSEWGVHNFILSQWIEYGLLGLLVYGLIILHFLFLRSSLPVEDKVLLKLGGVLFYLWVG